MATVNFSVPDDVRDAFNRTFAGRNKSAVIANLMREAVAREDRLKLRRAALDRISARRRKTVPAPEARIRLLRRQGRP